MTEKYRTISSNACFCIMNQRVPDFITSLMIDFTIIIKIVLKVKKNPKLFEKSKKNETNSEQTKKNTCHAYFFIV